MKKILVDTITQTVIIEYYMRLEFDNKSEPVWASIEDKEKGNFNGLALHKPDIKNVTILSPKDPSDISCTEFISVKLSPFSITEIAKKISDLLKTEENLVCEID